MVHGGSGNRNQTVGDSIFHCHFYPHFAMGMWSMWRVHDVFESGTWQLRHPVGPGAEGFLQWRKSFSDEEWVTLWSANDDTWYARIEKDFGLDTRPKEMKKAAS